MRILPGKYEQELQAILANTQLPYTHVTTSDGSYAHYLQPIHKTNTHPHKTNTPPSHTISFLPATVRTALSRAEPRGRHRRNNDTRARPRHRALIQETMTSGRDTRKQ